MGLNRLKVILQLSLLAIFTYFFGVPSLVKYHESKVLISESHQKADSIPAPAVTICGRDPNTEAWKDVDSSDSALDSSDNVFKCVENKAWAREDVVFGAQKGYKLEENMIIDSLWQTNFLKDYACFTFRSPIMIGKSDFLYGLQVLH